MQIKHRSTPPRNAITSNFPGAASRSGVNSGSCPRFVAGNDSAKGGKVRKTLHCKLLKLIESIALRKLLISRLKVRFLHGSSSTYQRSYLSFRKGAGWLRTGIDSNVDSNRPRNWLSRTLFYPDWSAIREQPVHAVRRRSQRGRQNLRIGVHRNRDRGVAEDLHDHARGNALS